MVPVGKGHSRAESRQYQAAEVSDPHPGAQDFNL